MARITMEKLQQQIAELSRRLERLENVGQASRPVQAEAVAEPALAGITEEEVLAISAAIGAFLGVRAHIRHIRLIGASAWAQQGRVSIQASHRLQA